jgi:hypothetical protein
MPDDTQFQSNLGTALATFAQGGTYSAWVPLSGRLVALYTDASLYVPVAAGSITFRSNWGASGTGWPVQTNDGTALKVLAFSTEQYHVFGETRWPTAGLGYVRLQVQAAGTASTAAGGTIVLVTQNGG